MRKNAIFCISLVLLFMLPLTTPFAGSELSSDILPSLTPYGDDYSVSDFNNPSVGTGLPLDVAINGIVSNVGEGSMTITSSTSGMSSVSITDGWTGNNLNAKIESLSSTVYDVLLNSKINNRHPEKFIVTTDSSINDDTVYIPDSWTAIKSTTYDIPHPLRGIYRLLCDAIGYGGTYGLVLRTSYTTSYTSTIDDEIYISQMVSIPWREVYSAQVSFRYRIPSGYTMNDQVRLFIRLGGYVVQFNVFQSGAPTDTWLVASATIPASSMQGLSNRVLKFDIGLKSNLNGNHPTTYSHIDDIQLDFNVRPFPEQVNLGANGTLVWGLTSGSVYPYLPDLNAQVTGMSRDCTDWNNESHAGQPDGIDVDGWGNDGKLEIGIYDPSSWALTSTYQSGLQFPVNIPQAAIITNAFVEIEAVDDVSSLINGMRVYVADTDNVTPFSITARLPHLEDRYAWVPTSVDWTLRSWIVSPQTRYRSPEITSLIQKVITRPGWKSGNYMCIMLDLMNAGHYQRWNQFKGSSHFDGDDLARLYIEYVIPQPEDQVAIFNYQKTITIDHTKVASTLTNFPVLIDLIDADLKNNVLSNGADIAFSLNGRPLDYEIELYDPNYSPTQAHLVAWVKIPSLSSTTDTTITMHYGSLDAATSSSSTKVWNDYTLVQHLNDDPSSIQYDSTVNNYHGTSYGNMSSANLVTGKIGTAINFDGIDDVISVGQIYSDLWSQFTVSAWVYHDVYGDDRIFSKATSTSTSAAIVHLAYQESGYMRVRLSTDTYSSFNIDSNSIPSNLAWHYLTWTWTSSVNLTRLYIDGSLDRSYTYNSWFLETLRNSDIMWTIANWEIGTSDTRNFDGKIDEIRMIPTLLSSNWIQTEWNNQNNPSSFYSVGTQTQIPKTLSSAGSIRIVFTTSSTNPVTLKVNFAMDISGTGQTLDEDLDPGTSFYIASGSNIVNWTAKVMVSPPAGATSMGFNVKYPMAEWKPTAVLNPFNAIKNNPNDWIYQAGTLTIKPASLDFWGIWTLKFISWNFVQDLKLGITGQPLSTTATFNIGDSMKFLATTPTVQGAKVGLILTDPTGSVWYSGSNTTTTNPNHKFPSFQYRKDIQIAPGNVYANVVDFPVALDFTDTDLRDVNKVRADGSDIMFAQGTTILPHQIEYFKQDYTVNTARFVGWVKANLSMSATTTITMYYGSPVVNNLQNPEAVWSNGFDAVWHLGEDVIDESTTGTHYDATGNGYNGAQNGNVETLSGKIGYGQTFDGNDFISISDTLAPSEDVMISGWFRLPSAHSSTSPTTKVLVEKFLNVDNNMVIALVGTNYAHGSVPAGSLVFKVESSGTGAIYKWTSRVTWIANTWYYVACYADASSPSNNQIFIGYTSGAWDTAGSSGTPSRADMNFVEEWQLGGGDYESSSTGQGWFTGILDEWRVASVTNVRATGWLQTEWRNQNEPSTFISIQSQISRTSPEHTLVQTLTSTAPAGLWTASAYYNDSGSYVSTRTGLFERTFTVKRNTYLTLNKPTDAVGDRLSVKTAGDAVIVEFILKDQLNENPINGATVTMNWTSPSTITLDAYGGGKYGVVVDTDDLADAKRWRIEVDSTHPYYNDASEYFDIDLYHNTELDYSNVATSTPVDFDFTATVIFTDSYTGLPIEGAAITFSDNSPVQSYTDEGGGEYSVTIDSNALSLGQHTYTLKATSDNGYQKTATVTITFTLRAHFTSVSVSGNFITISGGTTQVTVVLIDLDLGTSVGLSNVFSFSFTSSGNSPDTFISPSSYTQTLTTEDWSIGTHTVTLAVTMASTNFQTPSTYQFDITIRKHRTALTISGVGIQPYGNVTPMTIEFVDLDTGLPVPSSAVNYFHFSWTGGSYNYPGGGSLSFSLDTSNWPVGTRMVSVSTFMNVGIYDPPSSYNFAIIIRSMDSIIYLRPPASALYPSLVFPIGVDFEVYLQLNISESGSYYGDPITGRVAGEFSVPSYSIKSVDLSEQSIGRYKLSIDTSAFGDGTYEIVVYFTSNNNIYDDSFIVIRFKYRPIISYLQSPNYPQVTTPYQMNVEILLNYTDADFGTGIEGASITSPDHPTWIDNVTDLTGGLYSVWIDVSSLSQGQYYISLTADKATFEAKTLQFRIVIRVAYTTAIPSVGSLDIPLGSSRFFYVDYTDIDRLIPIDNATSPYTRVSCSWTNYQVDYLSEIHKYKITFSTAITDTIAQNVVYTFTFSKGTNYQIVSFTISVSIRTHNTDFRLVSAIAPASTIGIFNISVYYGDLDDAIGIKSSLVVFSVHNASGLVSSSYSYDLVLGDGFYIVQVPASQFGLGLQTFTIYADWTDAYLIYQDKSFVTTANVVGRESALTLLVASGPTPYLDTMSYLFFFSDIYSGIGIDNQTHHVFIYVSFQGQIVSPAYYTITDLLAGNYSIQIDTSGFSRVGIIYMDVSVEWAKGVAPFYANRTDIVSLRVLQRDTLLQISPPSPTSYGEIAQFNFTYDDVTGGSSVHIGDDAKLTITLNVPFTYSETGGTFTIFIDTSYYASIGQKTLILGVTWDGIPFYANRTGRVVYLSIILRETFVEYLAPAPTQYLDEVVFNVTWTDVTNGGSDPISGATLVLYDGLNPIEVSKYDYTEVSPGVYLVTLNTTYASAPGTYSLRVRLSIGTTGIADAYVTRAFNIRTRITLLSAESVAIVPYGLSIVVVLYYQDLFTSGIIANESANGYPVALQIIAGDGSNWIYSAEWQPVFEYYILTVETYNQAYATSTPYTLTLRMSYLYQSPYYASDDLIIQFSLRTRISSLSLTTEPETTPYGDNVEFTVYFSDVDASSAPISGATITIWNSTLWLTPITHYTVTQGAPGYYNIIIYSQYLGDLGSRTVQVKASKSGSPYHNDATRNVVILTRMRETQVEITVPPPQTLYLDDVQFTFVFRDLDSGSDITAITSANVHVYFFDWSPVSGVTIIKNGAIFDVIINSVDLTSVPVSGLSLRLKVDWDQSQLPFYSDDDTIVKVTITKRSMLVETEQIERTPKDDTMTITVFLSDMDNGNPISSAIIVFNCLNETMIEGFNFNKTEGSGEYTFYVYTDKIPGVGVLLFTIEVHWNPTLAPFYSNRSAVTVNGLVDYVRTSFQASAPFPPTVQISADVSFNVTYRDLDHNLPISGVADIIKVNVKYVVGGTPPTGLSVFETTVPGVYTVSFNTVGLNIGSYTIRIEVPSAKYAFVSVTPQFTVTTISTSLSPLQPSYQVDWTNTVNIYVNFTDLLHEIGIGSASVGWYLGAIFGDYLVETGIPGLYVATIDTDEAGTLFSAGTFVLIIRASAATYTDDLTTVTLVIMSLPSDIIPINPSIGFIEVPRGSPISISVILNDTLRAVVIDTSEVQSIYMSFESNPTIPLAFQMSSSTWNGTVPGSYTIVLPGSYTIRITVVFNNYQPTSETINVLIRQTPTNLAVIGNTEINAVFSQVIIFRLNLTETAYQTIVENATITWREQNFNNLVLNFTFSELEGLWILSFNTSQGFYGTWGLTFRAYPDDPILAASTTSITLTITKIDTSVIAPPISPEELWGWTGYINFTYYDISFAKGVIGAQVFYSYGTFTNLPAMEIGSGIYSIFINTTYLTPGSQHRIIVDFQKPNYQERTSGINIYVSNRPTQLSVVIADTRTYEASGDPTNLQLPMGDSLDIMFFFNDTSRIGGLNGGLDGATIEATLMGAIYFRGSIETLSRLGSGYYGFTFDTNNLTLYEYNGYEKFIGDGYFYLTVTLSYQNRISQTATVQIRIIPIPVVIEYEDETDFNLIHGDEIILEFFLRDTWHDTGVTDAQILYTQGAAAIIVPNSNISLLDGRYRVTILVVGTTGDSLIRLRFVSEFHDDYTILITVTANPNDTDILISQVTQIGLPISLLVITLLGLYVKVWSVPKRIRQINAQIKSIRKGKIPKPIADVKDRKQILADLFNDTYAKLAIVREASDMPEESVPIEVPEMGELLLQLAILTRLNAEELEEFKADISKMKMSEQAAFVKEVIMQEAIRAARRDGKSIEETMEEIQKQAVLRLGGEEELVESVPIKEKVESLLIAPEEEDEVIEFKKPKKEKIEFKEEEVVTRSERMSAHEIEQLRKDLERKGVPPYEIDTIIEQAKELPRELVEELVKSLEENKK